MPEDKSRRQESKKVKPMFAGASFVGPAAPHSGYPDGYNLDQALALKRIRVEQERVQVEKERLRFDERAQWRSELQLLASHAQKLGARPAPARPAADPLPPVSDGTSTIAQNLEAFRRSAKLSYRGLAKIIGSDHKAVSQHCQGKRVPEDRTLSEYASAFTRTLRRPVTVEELRGVRQ